jgi:translocation and assembly module TamB
MIRKLLHSGWILVAVLLVASLAALYYIGWTEAGFQTLSAQLSRRIGTVTLQLRGPRGTLAGGAHLDSFVLDHRRAHIESSGIDLRLAILPLFWGTIRAESVNIAQLQVRVLPRVDDNTDWIPHFLRAPLSIDVPQLHVASGQLVSTSGRTWDATALDASGVVHAYSIRVYAGALRYAGLDIKADGEVRAARPIGITGAVHFAMQPEGQPMWTANAGLDGNLDRLAIIGAVTEPFAADFNGAATALTTDWRWQGSSQVRRFDLRAWGAGNALGIITGALQLNGDRDGFHARGELTPPGLQAGPLQVDFDGSYAERVVNVATLRLVHRPSGTALTAAGTIGVVSKGPQLDLRGQWQSLRWPLADTAAPVHSASGEYSLRGLWPYALQAGGELRIRDLPSMRFNGSGQLDRDHIDFDRVQLAAFDGTAELRGSARWSPAEQWQLTGNMRGFNVASVRPGIDGRLNFQVQANGEGFGAAGTVASRFSELGGNVRGQRASGRAQVALDGDDWVLRDVRLQLGATRIEADGRVGEKLDLRFDVDASDLGLLHAEARGLLQARGRVSGNLQNPLLQLQANGRAIVWDQTRIGTLTATAAIDPGGSGRGDAELRLTALQIGDRQIDELHFQTTGTAAAHEATLELRAPQLQLRAAGAGSLDAGLWQLQLRQLAIEDGRDLQLTLEGPTRLALAADRQQLERLCLRDQRARLCGDASNRAGQRSISVLASNLPMRALTAGLVATTDFDGTLNIEGKAEAAPAADWRGQLHAQLTGAAARHRFPNGRSESFDLGTGSVDLTLDAAGLRAAVMLDAKAAGRIDGNATARSVGADWRGWPLDGHVQLESNALNVLDSYITEIDRASGRLQADLMLSGTLGAPQFGGELKVSDAQIDAYQVNLALRDLNFAARMNQNQLRLEGTATAGVDGKARFNGDLSWRDGLPYGNLHLDGENLRIVNIPEARVQASPDVDMKLDGRRIDITGTVSLPYARLEQPEVLASAVRASGDERIVSSEQQPSTEQFRVFSNVTLKLGERVTISTSGLAGRLSGSITAITDDTGFTRGRGELNIEEGKYSAYGRKLDIDRGRLIYSNSPLGDPGVDLRATRRLNDVNMGAITAGVNVRGTLSAPRMTFFSEPSIAQSQIASLLLAGSSLESAGGGTSTSRNSALLQGSAIIAQQLGSKLGIEDVSVEQNLQNETSLVLGRYLSPRLYLSYGVDLVESIQTFKLFYTIGDKWTLRTEPYGKDTGADIVYTIVR